MSNVCRRHHHQDGFAPRADLNRIVELMDRLGSAAEKSTELHRDPRNSLISNLGRHGDPFEGEVDDSTREDLVPELSCPVGSRWRRIGETEEVKRNSKSEQHFIDSLSHGEVHSLLPKAGDDVADERTRVGDVMGVLNEDLTKNCFFVDTLKKHYLTNPAKHAQRIRKQSENQPMRLPERGPNSDYFRVLRAPGSKRPQPIPSYLESEAIEEMRREGLQEVKFSVHRDLENEHYVTGKRGEVKSVKVKLRIKRKDGKEFLPIVELGAWQVCPWWSAVPDPKEWAVSGKEKVMRLSKLPEGLLEFGNHRMKIVSLGKRERLLCTTHDKAEHRKTFEEAMRDGENETLELQRKRIAWAAKQFCDSHQWGYWLAPDWLKTELDTRKRDRKSFEVQIKERKKGFKTNAGKTGICFRVEPTDPALGSIELKLTILLEEGTDPEEARKKVEKSEKINVRVQDVRHGRCTVRATSTQLVKLGLLKERDYKKLHRKDKSRTRGGSVKPPVRRRTSPSRPSSPSRAKKSSRRWIWVTLIGLGGIVLWMQFSSFRGSNDYSDFVPEAPVTQAPATTVFPPRTADDWFVALNCVEDPSERDIGRVATAVFVCYSESNPERHSISLFRYDDQPAQSELNRRVERACTKRGPTGEVFAFYSPGQPGFFVYTIYADAVARSRMPDLFERLSC